MVRISRRVVLGAALAWTAVPAWARHAKLIVAQGDSLTYGQDTVSSNGLPAINKGYQRRSIRPYPEYLGHLLGPEYSVINHGFPGDRTVEGIARWAPVAGTDVAILMYGTNDCLNYGGHPEGPVTLDAYRDNLDTLAKRQAAIGAHLIIVAPPPVANLGQDRRLVPYRQAAAQVAKARSALFVSVSRRVDLWIDGVHFSPAGNAALAVQLAKAIPALTR